MQRTSGVMTYQDIKVVWPYGPIRLDQLEFIHQTGTHAKLTITGIVPEDKEDEIINRAGTHDPIELYKVEGGQKQPIFMGRLDHVEIKVVRDIHYVTIMAVSHTYALDLSVKTRSFQQVNRLYRDVVDEIMSIYQGGDVIDQAFDGRQQGKYIMQYEETDWTFLKRIASHVGAVLVPDLSAHKVRLWIGMPEGRKQIKLEEESPYEVNRAIAPYMKKAANGSSSVSEYQYTTYAFDYDDLLQIGDEVQREGQTFVITKVTGKLEQGLLRWSYVCAVPEAVKQTKLYNKAIIGAAIDGKVIQIGRNQVKLHLNMDKKQEPSKAQWFPYAAEGNQILYLMPELGSKVKLYFPSADEDDGMVMNSVRHAPKGAAAEKQERQMQDPGVKTFGNPQGKEFTLGDKELTMTAKEGMLYISMNKDVGVSLKSTSNVNISASGALTLKGAAVSLSGTQSLSVKTASDTIELLEENKSSSEEIKLEASVRQAFPRILSAFEKDVQENGLAAVMLRRTVNNQLAEAKGKLNAFGDTLLGLWNTAVDAGDMLLTGFVGEENTQDLYEFVSGEEVGTLRERNGIVKGIEQGVNNTLNYVGDTVTGKKSGNEILSDIGKLGEGLYNDYIDPFVKEEQYKKENLFNGGLWTRSEEESYSKGENAFKKDMVVAEVGLTVLSAGTGTAVTRTVKMADKLDGPDGPHGRKKSGDHDRNGNGKGVLLPNSSIDDAMSAMLKDRKLKTHGKSFAESMIELQEKVDKLLKQMTGVFNGRIVVLRDAVTGQPMVYWMRHDDLPGNIGGGRGSNHLNSDAGNGRTGHAEKPLDTSNKKGLPKVVNGDSGHSNHSPSSNSKADSPNKNNSKGSNKPDNEARTGQAQHAEKPLDVPDKKDLPKVVNGDFGNSNHSTPPKGKGGTTKKNDPQGDKKPDTKGTGDVTRKPNHENIQEFVKGNKKFDEVLDDYALIYGDIVKSNKYWSWADDFVGKLNADQRKMIKDRALELHPEIPHVEVKKVEGLKFGYADFEGAGLVIVQDKLPKHLWLATDAEQFKWLNDRLPGKVQPEGTVWHHNEKEGIMQLVPFGIHNITKHNGGRTKGHWADAPRQKSMGSKKKSEEESGEKSEND
ncbi:HNH endonuclease signature motif containing protein [Brevibacillus brevis]|uniref:HNH endonuclease signature motif containing protein n=1 Tax=Brevibacillus brevis TaxID=1393 RepID=UPI00115AFC2F|nr:HNH endonuclease [Lysinibacillus sp. SDF0063]TQR38690.1 late control protein [Lysinibacillus sp. SDF0063]